ncbi:MAG: hypothetical protein FWG87_01420 [Defluviitaleaceae bacterium]|nr:hypothetical protein [Defluviitaleaceae bacterium]
MERGFSRILSAETAFYVFIWRLRKYYRLNADFTDLRRFTRILSDLFELSDFRGFYNEPIRIIRENPLNPCEALESVKSVFYAIRKF